VTYSFSKEHDIIVVHALCTPISPPNPYLTLLSDLESLCPLSPYINPSNLSTRHNLDTEQALLPLRELLYLDLALEATVRGAAERGAGASGFAAAALIGPLLQNLCLSSGDNEEAVYCLSSWQELPEGVRNGRYPNKEDALKVRLSMYSLVAMNPQPITGGA